MSLKWSLTDPTHAVKFKTGVTGTIDPSRIQFYLKEIEKMPKGLFRFSHDRQLNYIQRSTRQRS